MACMKITAAEARELAGPTPQERVNLVYQMIREAAKEGKRKLALHDEFWVRDAYSGAPAYKTAKELLEADGYKVSFYYNAGSFAVDMYTVVEW
jgi:hypothetical protein